MLANSPISDLALISTIIVGFGCLIVLVAWIAQRYVRLSPRGMLNLAMLVVGLFALWIAFELTSTQLRVRSEIARSVEEIGSDGLQIDRIGPLIDGWSNFKLRNDDGTPNLSPGGATTDIVEVDLAMTASLTGFTLVLAAPIAWLMVRRRRLKASQSEASSPRADPSSATGS